MPDDDDYIPDPETAAASQRIRSWLRARIQRALAEPPMPVQGPKTEPPKPVAPPVRPVVAPSKRKPEAQPNYVPITAQEIVARQQQGESVPQMAEKLGCSPDALWKKVRVAGIEAVPMCRHCGAETKRSKQAQYCYPCQSLKRKLMRKPQGMTPRSPEAVAMLATFDNPRMEAGT